MHMLMPCVLRSHQDCTFLSYSDVLDCQPMISCVSIKQLFALFWSIVQLYGIITTHLLKVINSRPCKTCCLHNSLPSYSTIHWILGYLKLESLKHRRTEADKKFFSRISQPDNCLYHLLPPPRDTKLITKLRYANKYPVPLTKTKRFCSFINFAIANYVD